MREEERERSKEREKSGTPIQDERASPQMIVESTNNEGTKSNGPSNSNSGGRTKWERHNDDSNISSDDNEELEEAYQKVERTLAEQQFGINV